MLPKQESNQTHTKFPKKTSTPRGQFDLFAQMTSTFAALLNGTDLFAAACNVMIGHVCRNEPKKTADGKQLNCEITNAVKKHVLHVTQHTAKT